MTARTWPAAERNRQPILEVLLETLPARLREGPPEQVVLEVACGTGQHASYFSPHFLGARWQPTDIDPEALASTEAWRRQLEVPTLQPPLHLDVLEAAWPVERAAVVYSANMVHISPWACTLGLLDGAARVLDPGGLLVLYGPYRVGGAHTAPSNEAFDASLKERDPSWGVRDLEAVVAEAEARGLAHSRTVPMPANNFTLVFTRR